MSLLAFSSKSPQSGCLLSPGFSSKQRNAIYTQILFPNDPPAKLNQLKVYFHQKELCVFSELSFLFPLLFTFILLITFIFRTVYIIQTKAFV